MNTTTAWFLACRPKTLTVSLSPVLLGTALAWQDSASLHLGPLLATALGAILIQIGTNLFNDVGDFLRGTDTPGRLGPARATAEGWLSAEHVQRGAWLAFALAFLCGLYLAWHGGWPIVAIGLASLAAGWAYTSGPRPIAYGPLGEIFVFVFFGVIAVSGSYYLQTLTLSAHALLAGALIGLPAAAVITVNNYRDLEGDRANGKNTLAVRLGRPLSRWLYRLELLLPLLILPGLLPSQSAWSLSLLSLPPILWLIHTFTHSPIGPELNRLLAMTAIWQFIFSLLFIAAYTI